MKTTTSRFSAFLMAALFAVGAQQAFSQPVPGRPGQPAHMHGFGIEAALYRLKGQLNLDTSQQLMWDNAAAEGKAAREAGRANMQNLRAAMAAELQKPEPDLAAMATLADSTQAGNQASRKQVRESWLKLYATFSPAQKAMVRDALKAKMARGDEFRKRMQERIQQHRGSNS